MPGPPVGTGNDAMERGRGGKRRGMAFTLTSTDRHNNISPEGPQQKQILVSLAPSIQQSRFTQKDLGFPPSQRYILHAGHTDTQKWVAHIQQYFFNCVGWVTE